MYTMTFDVLISRAESEIKRRIKRFKDNEESASSQISIKIWDDARRKYQAELDELEILRRSLAEWQQDLISNHIVYVKKSDLFY